jgi:hypothetical protein
MTAGCIASGAHVGLSLQDGRRQTRPLADASTAHGDSEHEKHKGTRDGLATL